MANFITKKLSALVEKVDKKLSTQPTTGTLDTKDIQTDHLKLVIKEGTVSVEKLEKIQKVMKVLSMILIYGFLVFMALIVLLPFYWMLITSLKTTEEIRASTQTFWPQQVMWSNYANALSKSTFDFPTYLVNTLVVGVVSTLGTLVTTIFAAFAFARLNFKGKNVMFAAKIDGISRQNNQDLDSLKISTVFAKPNVFSKLLKDAFEKHLNGNKAVFYLDKQNTINAMAKGGLQLSDINHFKDGVISRLTDFDSPVKPRVNSQIETQQFKRWFGDWENDPSNASKVVDEDGRPLVVYHGTDADFEAFDHTKGRSGMDIQGMFFSPWEIDAKGYGKNLGKFYLNLRNPANEDTAYKALRKFQGQNYAGKKAREYLIEQGYDGAIMGVDGQPEEFIAFYPNQIKSADENIGTFDNSKDKYRYSLSSDINEKLSEVEEYVDDKLGITLSEEDRKALEEIMQGKTGGQLNNIETIGDYVKRLPEEASDFAKYVVNGFMGDVTSKVDRTKEPYLWAKDNSTEKRIETPYEISRRTKIEQGLKTRAEEDRLVLKHLDADKNFFTTLIRTLTKPGALQDWMLKKASRLLAPFQMMKPVENVLYTVAENLMWDEAKQQMVIAPQRKTKFDPNNKPVGYEYDNNLKNGQIALDLFNRLNDVFNRAIS